MIGWLMMSNDAWLRCDGYGPADRPIARSRRQSAQARGVVAGREKAFARTGKDARSARHNRDRRTHAWMRGR